MSKQRIVASALSLSAAGLISVALHEGWIDTARAPVPGDVPTYGFSHTGPEVKLGTKIDPVRALILLKQDVGWGERAVRECAPVPMFQHEFDAYVDTAYNIGRANFCGSTMVSRLKAGDHTGACDAILLFKKYRYKGLLRDCSLPAWRDLCGGLWDRRQEMRRLCLGDQQ